MKQGAELDAAKLLGGEAELPRDRDRQAADRRGVPRGVSVLELEALGELGQSNGLGRGGNPVQLGDDDVHPSTPPFGG